MNLAEPLLALADSSAFLDLPAAEIPATAPLADEAQKQLLLKSIDYVKRQIPLLPDFMATERLIQFSDVPAKARKDHDNKPYDEKLHLVQEFSATVRFLGGKEEVAPRPVRDKSVAPAAQRLVVQGVFGPILSVVLKDVLAANPSPDLSGSNLSWTHWESEPAGAMAVFRFQVPSERSHYIVQDSEAQQELSPFAAYHGEIGLDPATGAILRLMLVADRRPKSPVARADILVEYGPQNLGGETYICPRKSVAVSLARDVSPMEGLYTYPLSMVPPFKLELNDTAYTEYHLFRTEMHVLTPDGDGDSGTTAPPPKPPR